MRLADRHRLPRARRFLVATVLVALVSSSAAAARLPIPKLVAVAVRALAYDRGLKDRVGPHLDILILHDGDAAHARAANEVLAGLDALSGVVVQGATLKASVVGIADKAALQAALDARGPDAVWLCGAGGPLLPVVIAEARARHITTITLNPDLVDAGVMLGVDGTGEKPKLIVHLGEARAAGVDFASDMLKLARVIR